MTEENGNGTPKAEKFDAIPNPDVDKEYPNTHFVMCTTGPSLKNEFCLNPKQKYEINMTRITCEDTDEEVKARYNCSIQDMLDAAVKQFTYGCDFNAVFNAEASWDTDGALTPEAHIALQTACDDYKRGSKRTKKSPEKALADKNAMSETDLAAAIARWKEDHEEG